MLIKMMTTSQDCSTLTLDENPEAGGHPSRDHNCSRRCQSQGTGAGDDEDLDRVQEPQKQWRGVGWDLTPRLKDGIPGV